MINSIVSKNISTSDGISLHYLESGAGQTIIMLPGWSQTAEQFKYQITGLQNKFHCLAIDMRGHGESEKTNHGYSISRLAKDLYDIITLLDLKNVILLVVFIASI